MRETSYFKQHSDDDGPPKQAKDLGELISIKNQLPQKSAPVTSNQETSASYKQPNKIPTASEDNENKSDRSTKSK